MRTKSMRFFAVAMLLACAACKPQVGTKAWCEDQSAKDKADWTAREAGDFARHCVIPGTMVE